MDARPTSSAAARFALRHLVGVLANDPESPPLAGGEIVTTSTLTRALPIAPGQTWGTP